jgi:hypothetical protein
MIVLGADTHKRSHTIAAVGAASGELLGEQTVQSGAQGAAALLRWARGLGDDGRVWALEDCRHVSGLVGAVSDCARRTCPARAQHADVGVATAGARARQVRVARAALREGEA